MILAEGSISAEVTWLLRATHVGPRTTRTTQGVCCPEANCSSQLGAEGEFELFPAWEDDLEMCSLGTGGDCDNALRFRSMVQRKLSPRTCRRQLSPTVVQGKGPGSVLTEE